MMLWGYNEKIQLDGIKDMSDVEEKKVSKIKDLSLESI